MSITIVGPIVLGALAIPVAGRAITLGRTRRLTSARSVRPTQLGVLTKIGRRVRQTVGAAPDRELDQLVGRVILFAGALAPFSVLLAAIVVVVGAIRPVFVRRARVRTDRAAVLRELPELIDLYAIALRNGHNVATATAHVVRWGHGTVADALVDCLDQVRRGRPLVDALDELPERLGEVVRPLTRVLTASERDGAPISEPLRVLAADIRLRRRREAEASARRIPVAMLFPLVVFILPAFMLLTVVPTLVQALSSLEP